jgi:hypothetical protein
MGKRDFWMRKIVTILFIATTFKNYAQSPIQVISKIYFRTHPFDSKFSNFILNLQKDPWFTVKEFYRRTDSTFFFLSSSYKNFNPFQFTPSELNLIVGEEEIVYSDSLQTHDTVMNLQLIGVADTGAVNSKLAEKEFKKFHQSHSRRFDDHTYKSLGGNGITTGGMYNYYISPFSVSPVTIAWGPLPDTKQYCFTITLRFKVSQNQAVYISHPSELKGL